MYSSVVMGANPGGGGGGQGDIPPPHDFEDGGTISNVPPSPTNFVSPRHQALVK